MLIARYVIFSISLSLFYTFIFGQTEVYSSAISIDIPFVAKLGLKSEEKTQVIKKIANNSVVHQLKLSLNSLTDNLWINYSATIKDSKETTGKKILVRLEKSLPSEMTLKLKVDKDLGKGGGNVGKPVDVPIILSTSPQVIISNIGTSFTGASYNHGHQINYITDRSLDAHLKEKYINIIFTLLE